MVADEDAVVGPLLRAVRVEPLQVDLVFSRGIVEPADVGPPSGVAAILGITCSPDRTATPRFCAGSAGHWAEATAVARRRKPARARNLVARCMHAPLRRPRGAAVISSIAAESALRRVSQSILSSVRWDKCPRARSERGAAADSGHRKRHGGRRRHPVPPAGAGSGAGQKPISDCPCPAPSVDPGGGRADHGAVVRPT